MAQAIPFIAAIVAATGALGKGFQERRVLLEQAKAEKQNARYLEAQAADTSRQAGLAEEFQRRESRAQFGELRASGAEAGLLSSNSFESAYSQAAGRAELDALNIRYEGELRRRGLLAEADSRRRAGEIIKMSRPSQAMVHINAISSGLSAYMGAGGSFGGGARAGGPAPVSASQPSYVRRG